MRNLIALKGNRIVRNHNNQKDPPVTIFRKHIIIAGETILISGKSGSNEDESGDHFIKTNTIAGTYKSISAKGNNTFAKRKNQNDLSGNRTCGNILQEAGNRLKEDEGFFPESENVLQEDSISGIISGNKSKEARSGIQEAKEKLREVESNLKNLGS